MSSSRPGSAQADKRVGELSTRLRKLQYHWSVDQKSKPPLDPNGSDYKYKHHLNRLMVIYTNHKPGVDNRPPKQLEKQAPLAQLYGTNGILRNDSPLRCAEKRDNWRGNTSQVRSLSPDPHTMHPINVELRNMATSADHSFAGNSQPSSSQRYDKRDKNMSSIDAPVRLPRRPRSAFERSSRATSNFYAVKSANGHVSFKEGHNLARGRSGDETGLDVYDDESSRHRSFDVKAFDDDVIIQGMYRLKGSGKNTEQDFVYNQFVEMLSNFDRHDMALILEDAFKDAQGL